MTTRRSHDDLSDPRVDAAWRGFSREEPSPGLDDALRAAARREAGAGPKAVGHVPSALRPQRWWWPLAAAATIGAVTIGMLQLVPHEQVAGPGTEKAVVSDVPAPPTPAQPMPVQPSQPTPAQSMPRQQTPQKSLPASAPQAESRKDAPPAVAEAFPGAPAKREENAASDAVPKPEIAHAPQAPAKASAPSAATAGENTAPATKAPSAPVERQAMRDAPTALGKTRLAASADARGEVQAQERPALPVADWIALIRKLRDDGRIDDAAKELAAFRAAHPDHALLLPPDLRDWRPEK